jgi:hypothetical protein
MAPPVVKSPIMLPYAGSSGMAGARQGDRARGGAVVDARHDVVLPPQGGPHGGGQAARGPRCDVQRSPLDVGFAHGASERSSALQRGAAGTSAAGALQEQPMGLAGKRRLSGGGVAPVGRKAKAAPPVLECESPQVGWPKHVEAAADGAKDAVVITPQGVWPRATPSRSPSGGWRRRSRCPRPGGWRPLRRGRTATWPSRTLRLLGRLRGRRVCERRCAWRARRCAPTSRLLGGSVASRRAPSASRPGLRPGLLARQRRAARALAPPQGQPARPTA